MLGWICWERLWIEACATAVGCYIFEIDGLQVEGLIRAAVAPEPDRQEGGHVTRIVLNGVVIDRDCLRKVATQTNNGYRQREYYYYGGYCDHYRERGWRQPTAPRHRDFSHVGPDDTSPTQAFRMVLTGASGMSVLSLETLNTVAMVLGGPFLPGKTRAETERRDWQW